MDVAEQGQSQVRPSLLQFKKDLKREKKDAVVGCQKNDQTWVWALSNYSQYSTVIIHNCYDKPNKPGYRLYAVLSLQ